jgi:hypothetical protein
MRTTKNEAEIKVKVRRNPRKLYRNIVLLLITSYFCFLIYDFFREMVITHLAKAEQVQQGILQIIVPAKGILVRNEKAAIALRPGKLKILASEGERIGQ